MIAKVVKLEIKSQPADVVWERSMRMSLPQRWLKCPRKGQVIAGKFIPFKTPLGPQYDLEIPEDCRFNTSMLLAFVDSLRLQMGMVIDLTKTDRYYDKREMMERDIGHYKLQCEGFGEAPTQEQVNEFKQVCSHFFAKHPGDIIGIHCTHGYNRTGFLVSAYLVEVEDWSLEAAVAAFSKSRPPGIYKGHYLKDLADRYNGGSMSDIVVPERPLWCFEGDDPDEQDDNEAAGKGKGKKGTWKRKGIQNENAKFVEGVSGVETVKSPLREEIQQYCQSIIGWQRSGFPGSQPVSMDTSNIKLLCERPYRVSWKADGTRYVMYIRGHGETYMLDRDNAVFAVPQLSFPARKRPGDFVRDTLVDGEMVLDKTEDGLRPRYLMYDVMQFEGNADVARCEHHIRTTCIQRELVETRDQAVKQGTLQKHNEPFSIRAKQFWDVAESRYVLERFSPRVTHETDGLIFSPAKDPYLPGQCNELLKWKPPELNTVDFKLIIMEERQTGMLPQKIGQLYVSGYSQRFAVIDLKKNKEVIQHNGRIVECCWDMKMGWKFLRLREDKSFPNSVTTAKSVCNSIQVPVTKDILLKHVEDFRWQPKKRPHDGSTPADLMPPPKMNPRTTTRT